MRIGFIGTGNITFAMVTGLCTAPNPPGEIWVSARNQSKAETLSKTYDIVQMAAPNQVVVDRSDILFLAFLPGQEKEILSSLIFRENQTIVTLLSGTPLSGIPPLVKPVKDIVRAIPLPCTALHTGPVVMYPANKKVEAIFNCLGNVIIPGQEKQLETFSGITALMAPFYAMILAVVNWGEENELARHQAAAYTGAMFKALSLISETAPEGDIQPLISECMTPGGLNETAMKVISKHGGFTHMIKALDEVLTSVSD